MFTGFLTIFHVIVCVVLIAIVLMQSQQSMNLSGMFGGASQSALGNRPESMLSRATTVLAIVFMLTSVVFAMWPSQQEGGALQPGANQPAAPTQQQPATGQQGSPAGGQDAQQQDAPSGANNQSQQEQGTAQPAPSPSPES